MAGAMTRRSALGTFGAVGAALATGTLSIGTPARAQAQGQSQALGLQESVQDGLKRVFGGRPMKDGAALMPFFLDGVGGYPRLNQPDGLHPTAPGYRVIVDRLWPHLRPLLKR